MSWAYGESSQRRLGTAHHDLQIIAVRLIDFMDITILQSSRTIEEQIINIVNGVSETINSRHIPRDADGHYAPQLPSMALDLAPYPIDWNSDLWMRKAYFMQGMIRVIAEQEGIAIIQGVDWDMDSVFRDQTFHDAPHLQLDKPLPRLIVPASLLESANAALADEGLPEWVNR